MYNKLVIQQKMFMNVKGLLKRKATSLEPFFDPHYYLGILYFTCLHILFQVIFMQILLKFQRLTYLKKLLLKL